MSTPPSGTPTDEPIIVLATEPNYDGLVTDDHKPAESIQVEKQRRLLALPLYASWPGPGPGRSFLVLANVGWFYQDRTPAVAPDCLLSLDVTCPEDLYCQQGRSYYQWRMGKAPDVIIELVSDNLGGEESFKQNLYARQGVPYYAIYDPEHHLSQETLRTFELHGRHYQAVSPGPWPSIGLGLRLWQGEFENHQNTWLRWCDAQGEIIPTAEERARLLAQQVTQAEERIRLLEEELRRLKGEQPPS